MLALESPRWFELRQAYGSAENIPALLSEVQRNVHNGDAWTELYQSLCHQGNVLETATFAAIPHVVSVAQSSATPDRILALAFVGLVASLDSRFGNKCPEDLRSDFETALDYSVALILNTLSAQLDHHEFRSLLVSLAHLQGHSREAEVLDGYVDCPFCDQTIDPFYDYREGSASGDVR